MIIFSLEAREIKILPKKNRYQRPTKSQINKNSPNKNVFNSSIESLKSQNQKIENLLNTKLSKPNIFDKTSSFDFVAGTLFKGVLFNSILSTNLPSPIIININDARLPMGTKLLCQGITRNKRVDTKCSTIIINQKEYAISSSALNIDGSFGLVGQYFDGKESYFASSLATDFIKGMTDISKTTQINPFGIPIPENSVKNKLLEGSTNAMDRASDLLLEESKTEEAIIFIKAPMNVLIFLTQGIFI